MNKLWTYVDGLSQIADKVSNQVEALLEHPGEKGRAVEAIVRDLVRNILPQRYSLGTGFVTNSAEQTSFQQDLVIFDNLFNAPIKVVGDVGVFPIECVYACTEVKTTLEPSNLPKAMIAIGQLRSLTEAKYYSEEQWTNEDGVLALRWVKTKSGISPRSYLIALDADYASINSLVNALDRNRKDHKAVIHGLLVLKKDWLVYQTPSDPDNLKIWTTGALRHFTRKLLVDLMTFDMKPMDIESYIPRED